ncbi:MAG: RIP metalloprotease RseP [Candidatus Omnitrophota bacterium]|nr:MAG: RIP metalloprotease RseP [Candidatus Omnitrophota bacterium]HDN86612.1 RIP metalloprotease RseP [Candidatus Omnitrophota bacterium]
MLLNILIFLFTLSLLVVSHEFGHFLGARLSGVKVEKFALGFGPPLVKFNLKETTLLVCLIPLGGYVKLAGDQRGASHYEDYEFFSKPVGVRAKIVFFGPLFNFILTLLIFWGIFTTGFPSSQPIIGKIIKYAPIPKSEFTFKELEKLKENHLVYEEDREKYFAWTIPKINLERLKSLGFTQYQIQAVVSAYGDSLRAVAKKNFSSEEVATLVQKGLASHKLIYWSYPRKNLEEKLSQLKGVDTSHLFKILEKYSYPGYRAGLKEGDRILEVNGKKVRSWQELSQLIRESNSLLTFKILREDKELLVKVNPYRFTFKNPWGEEEQIAIVGIGSKVVEGNFVVSFFKAWGRMGELCFIIGKSLLLLILKKLPLKEAVAGPIGVGFLTVQVAKAGLVPFFNLVGVLSLSLGIINLFPFPVLDGGHLFLMLLEKLKKKPLSEKCEEVVNRIGLSILVALMVIVSYNDIIRLRERTPKISYSLAKRLSQVGIVKEIENDGDYIFWEVSEKELKEKLKDISSLDTQKVLSSWRNSLKVIRVRLDNE